MKKLTIKDIRREIVADYKTIVNIVDCYFEIVEEIEKETDYKITFSAGENIDMRLKYDGRLGFENGCYLDVPSLSVNFEKEDDKYNERKMKELYKLFEKKVKNFVYSDRFSILNGFELKLKYSELFLVDSYNFQAFEVRFRLRSFDKKIS